jgi:hypothetical protein
MAGMFGKKTVVTKSTTKKPTHEIIPIAGKTFAENLTKFNDVKNQIKKLTATQKTVEGEIKMACLDAWIGKYVSSKKNPSSVILKADNGEATMFIVQKKYSGAVDEERATDLREVYGENFVEESTECIVNQDLLNKYGEKIEEMFMKYADFMSEDEKMELFEMKSKFSIKTDAIDEAFICGNGDVEQLVSDINPVLMLKEAKV